MQFPIPTSEKGSIEMAQTEKDTRLECLDRALKLADMAVGNDLKAESIVDDAKTFETYLNTGGAE
jgi:hypothetical protein